MAAATERERWLRRAVWTIVVVSVVYAPIAMTDLWRYRFDNAPVIGETLLGKAVSPQYVAEALATRLEPYRHSWMAMVIHSVLGGLLMLLGPVQLISALKRKRGVHRRTGVVYAIVTLVSMAGAGVYLARTPTNEVYSGALFQVALAAILLGTVLAVIAGVFEITQGRRQTHQRWMVLSYGFLLTAPLLRLEWGALPAIWPDLTMDQINRIGSMTLGGLVAFGALCVSRALDRRPSVRGVTGTWAPWIVLAPVLAIGAAGLAYCGTVMLDGDAQNARQFWGFVVPFAVCTAIAVVRWRRAAATGRTWPAEEWRLHLLGLGLVPLVSLLVGSVLGAAMGLDRPTAVATGLVVGWGTVAVFMTSTVNLRLVLAEADGDRAANRERRRQLAAAR